MSNVTVQEAFRTWYKSKYYKYDIYPKYHQFRVEVEDAFIQGYKDALSEIEKCEPVAEAIRERDRLGFSVVNVIGKLDEIIENTQEVEIDDFLHIAVPVDMWNELQAALEDMPKRADIYTSPQPRDCEDWQYFDKAYKKAVGTSDATDWMNAALMAQQVRRNQLNTEGKS